ncbi:RagB/SusD family nutrient uptake outer membrane protein [Mucilaginibacter sabulilitoris]|uniref:RagB/SusD family nutrient uptake outer membrane protein n=1 Tax=Mucilaginibacter sabulilitoris TaxID=1173583 RepID=A0ABZ0THV9_9SPHI|nr:RagB/SusD family nutrient uptake outer membrane protein [Mucilaginibacter sabulilitoris]WPU92747.1 RagB/SusD family nutrient uptake outer membrane protein [Mucilaginibacter sabulilitoris]
MKRLLYILPLFVIFSSCKKFLDVQPQQQVDESLAITDAGSAGTAVNGLYNTLGSNNYYGSNFPAISYLYGSDVVWTGSQAAPQEISAHKTTAYNGYISSAWGGIYKTILSANYILEAVPKVTDPLFTAATKNQYLGEAYATRALSYFDLARGWGGVQLILTPTHNPSDHAGIKRSTLADTYAQVLKDLEAAEGLLPATTNRNRFTQKTIWALKARFYLYNKQWALAEQYATKIISDNANYNLLKPYSAFFTGNIATSESVFEIAYSTSFKNNHSTWFLPPALGGRREWAPSSTLVSLLNDPNVGGGRSSLIAQTAPPGNLWYGKLYYRTPLGVDPAYIIRVAELYLIRSEARAEQNNLSGALEDLNAVRDRSGVAASKAATQGDILLAIEAERQVEFPFETDRWFNLVRTNRVAAVLGITDATKYLFPIPASELLADPDLTPNPGY